MPKGPKGERRPADLNKRGFTIVQGLGQRYRKWT
jgi:hypothetical protein